MLSCFSRDATDAILVELIKLSELDKWLSTQSKFIFNWVKHRFAATSKANQAEQTLPIKAPEANILLAIPSQQGDIQQYIYIADANVKAWWTAALVMNLPEGKYRIDNLSDDAVLAWGLSAYQFTRYKTAKRQPAQLVIDKHHSSVENILTSVYLIRDLINTPADDMGPSELTEDIHKVAVKHAAHLETYVGEDLLTHGFHCIYTVGRASDDAPRLLDLRWGDKSAPKVTLVGKGVCFDTGGLDIKSSAGMLLMKKDMGGCAHVLGLAQMIMQAKLNVQLRVLMPIVENSVGGNAYRPGDVIRSKQGLTIEIGNTDAEGRLILADALTAAAEDNPELLIDIATLTGAARVAVGTDIAAMFCNDQSIAREMMAAGEKVNDPMWQLPLFSAYRESLNSPIADINNAGSDGYAGAITAALFLKEFVPDNIAWMHFDIMAWNLKAKLGKPVGAEAMAVRGIFEYLKTRYS